MKKLNERQNNKGFSLVELIVVIAIMVVLVAVLAPVFTRYIENSRRSTDVSTANNIAEAVLADAADGKITADKTAEAKAGDPSTLASDPVVKGTQWDDVTTFTYEYNKTSNTVKVYLTGHADYDLTDDDQANAYKDLR